MFKILLSIKSSGAEILKLGKLFLRGKHERMVQWTLYVNTLPGKKLDLPFHVFYF